MSGYNTNLAAEFFVLSLLHRKGLDANLTLGNKKAVDILVAQDSGPLLTIDVKGLAGSTQCLSYEEVIARSAATKQSFGMQGLLT